MDVQLNSFLIKVHVKQRLVKIHTNACLSHTYERDGVRCGWHDLCNQQHEHSQRQQDGDTYGETDGLYHILLNNQYRSSRTFF